MKHLKTIAKVMATPVAFALIILAFIVGVIYHHVLLKMYKFVWGTNED